MAKLRIGVIGQSGEISEKMYQLALEIGREIGRRQAILLSGGRDGVMEAVSKGASSVGGTTVGILPGNKRGLGNPHLDIPLTTGLDFDYRSNILVHSSDVIIMLGGGNGTLGELSLSYLNRRPIVVVEGSGGWSDRIRDLAYEGKYLDQRSTIEIKYASEAGEAVELACQLAQS